MSDTETYIITNKGNYFVEDIGYFIPISLPFLKEDEPYYIGDGDEK